MTKKTKTGKARFSLDDVLEAARAIVSEKGESYIYPRVRGRCLYADGEGGPSCLVGHVINRLDPQAFDKVAQCERDRETRTATNLISSEFLDSDFWTHDAEWAMHIIQLRQDEGAPWGEALACAEDLGGDVD